jgi:hypothetical protein
MDRFGLQSPTRRPAFADRTRRSAVRGSVRFLELHTRRYEIPKTVRFQVSLTRRLPETSGADIRRCVTTCGVGPSEDLPDTCPIHPWMSPSTDALSADPLPHRVCPARKSPRKVIRADCDSRRPHNPGHAGQARRHPPNQTTIWCLDRGRTDPKAGPSGTAFDINQHASTPTKTVFGTFARQPEDHPAGPSTRKYPTPGSHFPTWT